jgi:hypothetical protein
MSTYKRMLAGAVGLAALIGTATPASAQYYQNYGSPYGGYQNNYGANVGQAVGQAINGVLGAMQYGQYPYGNYGYNQNYYGTNANDAVGRCSGAVEARLNGYGGYGQGRVTGIRNIEPRKNGALRVFGFASSYSGYGYGQPNLAWSCKIDRYGRVTDVDLDRDTYRRW